MGIANPAQKDTVGHETEVGGYPLDADAAACHKAPFQIYVLLFLPTAMQNEEEKHETDEKDPPFG